MRKVTALLLAVLLLWTANAGLGETFEDEPDLVFERIGGDEETGESPESEAEAAEPKEIIYRGFVTRNYPKSYTNVYTKMDTESEIRTTYYAGRALNITAVYPYWVEVRLKDDSTGYVIRQRVDSVSPVDVRNTAPYGVEVNAFYALADRDIPIYAEKDRDSKVLTVLTLGAKVSFIGFEDGWAKLIFKRQYGYINSNDLGQVFPVAFSAEDAADLSAPIAVYTSFYDDQPRRINNLARCCLRMNRVMKHGEILNFNESVGPFNTRNGYMEAPILIDGETKLGYGGGSCQVSSTLYNVVLQLSGITVLERNPHGASGAKYLPHGMDASSGDLNFIIRNDYPFPVRIEGSVHDFALFIAIFREE